MIHQKIKPEIEKILDGPVLKYALGTEGHLILLEEQIRHLLGIVKRNDAEDPLVGQFEGYLLQFRDIAQKKKRRHFLDEFETIRIAVVAGMKTFLVEHF